MDKFMTSQEGNNNVVFLSYGKHFRDPWDMTVGDSLDLLSLRKEQRRVAALLQVDADPPQHKKKRKPLAGELFWCSYLDPEGKHRDPALDYMRQGLHQSVPMTLDDLRKDFRYVKEKNDELFNKDNDKAEEMVNKKGNNSQKPRVRINDNDKRLKHKENEYKNLHNSLSNSQDGLKLPNIQQSNRVGRRSRSKDDGKERMHVRLPKEKDDVIDDDARRLEFLKRKRQESYRSRGLRKGRRNRNKKGNFVGDSDSAFSSGDEQDVQGTLLSDGMDVGTPSELADLEPYLRYSHGMNPVSDGKELIKSLVREASNGLIRITSFVKEISYCSCGSGHEVGACPECNRTGHHSKRCSKRTKGRKDGKKEKQGRDRQDWDDPKTLIGEREATPRCLKCGKAVRQSREHSYVSGVGQAWSRDSSATSGSYKLIRSSSESRIGSSERDRDASRSRSASPTRRGKRGKNVDSSRENLLDMIDRKLREGAFDYDVNTRSVDDINQSLVFGVGKGEDTADDTQRTRKPKANIDIYREAYIKALSVARSRNLPQEPWMFGSRTSRAFVYSYYHYIPYRRPNAAEQVIDKNDENAYRYEPQKIIKKRGAEMKMIFGNVDPDDYLPGGPKNLFAPNPFRPVKLGGNGKPGNGVVGRRRVQQAKPSFKKQTTLPPLENGAKLE